MTNKSGGVINPQSVDSPEIDASNYQISGTDINQFEVIQEYTQIFSGTTDTSAFNQVLVIGIFGNNTPFQIRVDGNTNSEYNFLQLDDGGIASTTNNDHFIVAQSPFFASTPARVLLTKDPDQSASVISVVSFGTSRGIGRKTMLRGYIDNSNMNLDSVEAYTDGGNEINRVSVFGRNVG